MWSVRKKEESKMKQRGNAVNINYGGEFAFRHFDFEISIRTSRQLIAESGIQKRSGSCWQIVCQ